VAVALGIDIEVAAALPDFDPRSETRTASPRPASRGPYKKRADVDARLGPFRLDAVAGVSDDLIARRAGLSREQVRQWRRRQRIAGRRGRTPPQLGARYALDALVHREDIGALVHLAASSPVQGRWRPPEYVLRRPLRYDAFVEVITHAIERFTTAELAEALGFEERDIIDALALHARRAS
jgi:hypothetical protein